jgi:hypothetical protein
VLISEDGPAAVTFVEYVNKAHAYIDRHMKKAQATDFLPSQNPVDEGLGSVFPESKDATMIKLNMAQQAPLTKEDFAILSTKLDGIDNRINVLSNEVTNYTGIIVKKLEQMTRQWAVQKRDQAIQTKHQAVQTKLSHEKKGARKQPVLHLWGNGTMGP